MSVLGRLRGHGREPAGRDVLLTGVPRSGTTLSCHLLNKVPGTVALHEPMEVNRFFGVRDPDEACRLVERFCRRTREGVLERGTAPSKQVGGKVPDNPVASEYGAAGVRPRVVSKGEVAVGRDVGPDFTLVVKHPGLFTVFLEALVPRFPVFAIVRNPLSVLASWNSVALHVREGRVPATERLDPELGAALERIADPHERQLHLLGWYFGRYDRVLPRESVIRYEEVVASRGRALAAVVPGAAALDEDLRSRNRSELYDRALMRSLAERLLGTDGPWWRFYSRSDVESLLA